MLFASFAFRCGHFFSLSLPIVVGPVNDLAKLVCMCVCVCVIVISEKSPLKHTVVLRTRQSREGGGVLYPLCAL